MRLVRLRLMVLMLITSVVASWSAPTSMAAAAPAKVTVMVYMNGSDLESEGGSASGDLQEMWNVGSRSGLLNIVVETLGTNEWHTPGISNESNQRWLVTDGSIELVHDDLGLRRLDDPSTLTDFIVWSTKNYPADRYILVFWDHGAGSVDGFGGDELHDNSSLNLAGIRKGIADAVAVTGKKFDLIGFDTCLMATIEVAAMLSPFANYMVASEELEPGHGWDYAPFMQALVNNPVISGPALGKVIVDAYRAQAIEQEQAQNITLSVIDLSKAAKVVTALEQFVTKVGSDIRDPGRINLIAKARSAAEDYGNGHDGASDMVDLGHLAQKSSATYPQESQKLLSAVQEAVLYKIGSPGSPFTTGLSVYFPLKDKAGLERKLETYLEHTPFSQIYKDFVQAFSHALFRDTVKVEFTSKPVAIEGGRGRKVSINPDQAGKIAEVYSVVTTFDEPGSSKLLFIGMDNDVDFDPETGEIWDNFTGEIVTLNDRYVSLFFENEGDEFASYSIPIRLNGKQMDLKVLFNFKTGAADIIGGWTGINPVSHMAAKNLIKVNPGDRIVPLFYYYDVDNDTDGYLDGEEFVVEGPLVLGVTDLPEGDYEYGFYIKDFAGNESYSDFVTVSVGPTDDPDTPTPPTPGPPAIRVVLNGQELAFDVPPEIRNDRTLVPVRAIFEALGSTISWDGVTRTVTAVKGNQVIELQIDNSEAKNRGQTVRLDQAPVISNGRTLVPLRFVSESLGGTVIWDAQTRTVYLIVPR